MSQLTPFKPLGDSYKITGSSVASAAFSPSTLAGLDSIQLVNGTTDNVYVAIGKSTATAATLPTTAAGTAFLLRKQSERVLGFPNGGYISFMTTAVAISVPVCVTLGVGAW